MGRSDQSLIVQTSGRRRYELHMNKSALVTLWLALRLAYESTTSDRTRDAVYAMLREVADYLDGKP